MHVCVCVNIIVEIGECAINFIGKIVIPKFSNTVDGIWKALILL